MRRGEMHTTLIGSLFTTAAFGIVFFGIVATSIVGDLLITKGKSYLWIASVTGALFAETADVLSMPPYNTTANSIPAAILQVIGFIGLGIVFVAPVIAVVTASTKSYILRACLYGIVIGVTIIVAAVCEKSFLALSALAVLVGLSLGVELAMAIRHRSITNR